MITFRYSADQADIENVRRIVSSSSFFNADEIEIAVELGSGKVLTGLLKRISRRWLQPPALYNIEDMASLEKFRQTASGG